MRVVLFWKLELAETTHTLVRTVDYGGCEMLRIQQLRRHNHYTHMASLCPRVSPRVVLHTDFQVFN